MKLLFDTETQTQSLSQPNSVNTTDLDRALIQGIAPWQNPISRDHHVAVYADGFPVTLGHRLFVPLWNTPVAIWHAFRVAQDYGDMLVTRGDAEGYNLGINMGRAAGQTVMYPHVHCIPRRLGDCQDPVGGVRGVIPGQANYRQSTYTKP